MEQEKPNNQFKGVEVGVKRQKEVQSSNSSNQPKTPINRTLRLEYNEIMKLLKEQATKISSLEKEVALLKRVLVWRR